MDAQEPVGSNPPTIEIRAPAPDVAQVVLGGEHDLGSADRLSAVLTDTLGGCSHLVVDISTAEFIDSSTIRVLIATKERADGGGREFSLLLGTAPIVERILEITGVLVVLNRVHSLDEALAGSRDLAHDCVDGRV